MLGTLKIKVADTAVAGDYEVSATTFTVKNEDSTLGITTEITDGKVTVEDVVIFTSSYTVEYRQLKVNGTNGVEADYIVAETETFTDIAVDSDVTAQIKTYTGFAHSTAIESVLEGKVASDGSLVLVVYYDRIIVDVTYNEDGGTAVDDTTVQYGSTITLPGADSTTKSGFTLGGWEYNGTNYAPGETVTIESAEAVEIKAIWSQNLYTVIFYDGWGDSTEEYDVYENDTVEEEKFPNDELESATGYEKNEYISAELYSGENEYVHEIKKNWYYNIPGTEEWILFTPEVAVTDDIVVDGKLHVRQRAPYLSVDLALNNQFIDQDFVFSTFYEETLTDENGNVIAGTRVMDSIKDILWNSFNTQNGETLFQTELNKVLDAGVEKLAAKGLLDSNGNILSQNLFVRFSTIVGEEKLEDYIVDNAKESIKENEELKPAIIEYYESKAEKGGAQSIEEIEQLFADKGIRDALTNNEAEAIDELIILAQDVLGVSHPIISDLDKIKTDDSLRQTVIDEVSSTLAKSEDYSEFDYFITFVITHLEESGELDSVVDEIIEEQYRPTLNKFVNQLINDQIFEIDPKHSFILSAFEMQVKDYSFDELVSKVPDAIFKIYPKENLEAIYTAAYNNLIGQIDAGKENLNRGENAVVDTGMTFVINPVEDVYAPLRNRFAELVSAGKVGQNYYYAENKYLQELIKLTQVEELFDASDVGTGYKLKEYNDYYALILKYAIIGDDALCWYRDELSDEELDNLILGYEDLALSYANGLGDAFEGNVTNGNIVTKLVAAFKEKAPSLAEKIGNAYLSSPFNREYSSDDYAKLRNAVRQAFGKIDYTTDETFDVTYKVIGEIVDIAEGKITPENINKVASKFTNLVKVDGNTYTASLKGKTVKIVVGDGVYTAEIAGKVITINITGENVYTVDVNGKTISLQTSIDEYIFTAGSNIITINRSIR
ncbi:MAG: InlB B-repeat-containing protein [Clostridia bacterium]|nr:InlB B-repeat-containing protein [Clostridia bacterium]